jgi:hypothetical membrane protein
MTEPTALTGTERRLALGGIIGVGGFVGAWVACGLARDGYSPVDDAISRLAESGTSGRGWMTAGFVAFGVGVPLYSLALRRALDGPAWITALTTGIATLGVAAFPLGDADTAHAIAAVTGYATLAATPALATITFRRRGASRWATASAACAVGSAALLTASIATDRYHGASQRLGLLVTDGWIVATAWTMWRRARLP